MNKNIRTLLLIILVVLLSISCSKDKQNPIEPKEQETIIPKTTKPITMEEVNNNLISISDDSTTFTFKKELNNKLNFKKDDIIIIPNGKGLLRKVTLVQTNNNKTVIKTQQGNIAEAIEKGK